MEESIYKDLSRRKLPKKKPRTKPLPKATEKYLEAEELLIQQLFENRIAYIAKFQFKTTKHWRFDFHIVRKRILIEIVGSPWATGRGGKSVANDFNKYDHAEELGYEVHRFEPAQINSNFVINWIINLFN